ncbi:NAD(P)-dependent oxidoreductase [Micrococcus luteus]|uniref:NAD-dependent epimerase/dehydratase family protein n=1 Tax=Micrococcus luteus TaxID=1270 RepID=UPI00340B033E
MRFVVTGAGGFLGSTLVRELLSTTDHEVVAASSQGPAEMKELLERPPFPRLSRAPHVHAREELLQEGFLQSGDVVVNCAFPWNRGGTAMAQGLEYLTQLFKAASSVDLHSFVNVSSQSVYSQARTEPAAEDSPIECDTPYSTGKYAMELAAALVLSPQVLVNARMSSLIGVGYDVRIVNRFIKKFLAGDTVTIQGGEQTFDFMDVRDAARALIAVALAGPPEGSTALNIGGGAPRTLRDIAQTVADVVRTHTEHEPRIDWEPSAGDDRTLGLDSGLLRREYDFAPRHTLEDSALNILQAMTTPQVTSVRETPTGPDTGGRR